MVFFLASWKTDLKLSAKLQGISLEEPELQAEIQPELPGGPELTQVLPLTGQLTQRALHRAYRACRNETKFKKRQAPKKKNHETSGG